jgi:hypothetical protein
MKRIRENMEPRVQCSFVVCVIVGFELRDYTLNHSTSSFLCWVFSSYGLTNDLPGLAFNHDPPDLCLLSS